MGGNQSSSSAPDTEWEYPPFKMGQRVRTRVSGEKNQRGTVAFENGSRGDCVGVRLDDESFRWYAPYNLELLINKRFDTGNFSFNGTKYDTDIVEVLHATGTSGCPHIQPHNTAKKMVDKQTWW